jgi:hypothetical protein
MLASVGIDSTGMKAVAGSDLQLSVLWFVDL